MKKIYVDIDGVLLSRDEDGTPAPARHCDIFIGFLLDNFDCYWLTTHCQGDIATVVNYLKPYLSKQLLEKVDLFKPTSFHVLKTEALEGDYYWIDDNPLHSEMEELKKRNHENRIIIVDTRKRPDDLLVALEKLRQLSCN